MMAFLRSPKLNDIITCPINLIWFGCFSLSKKLARWSFLSIASWPCWPHCMVKVGPSLLAPGWCLRPLWKSMGVTVNWPVFPPGQPATISHSCHWFEICRSIKVEICCTQIQTRTKTDSNNAFFWGAPWPDDLQASVLLEFPVVLTRV